MAQKDDRVSRLRAVALAPVRPAARVVGFAFGTKKVVAGALGRMTGHARDDAAAAPDPVVREPEVIQRPRESASEEPPTPAVEDEGPAVDLLPYPQLEEPIPVVEQALAAEAEGRSPLVAGHATEPKATTRDEEHGDAHLQRAEEEEIAEEVAETLPGGDLDVETSVGTTGAGVGHNPST